MTQVLSTDSVAPLQRVAYWQEMVCQTFVQAHCDSRIGTSFRGSIRTESFDQIEISRIEAGRQRIRRRAVDVARSSKPRYYLCFHTSGHARYVERHAESLLGPGQMILLDNCEPYTAEYVEPVSSLVMHVPHALLQTRFRRPEPVVGRSLGGHSGLLQIAGGFLQSCLTQAQALNPSQREAMASVALDLFASVLAEASTLNPDIGSRQAVLLARIKRYVLTHLGEPGLDPAQIAAAAGISERHLSRLFGLDGLSVGRYLLQQRIERCRRMLADPAQAGRQVGEIAMDCGFNNHAHFSRVFRTVQGCSPSEYRAEASGRSLP